MLKCCSACGISKDLSHFYKAPLRSDAVTGWCKECIKTSRKAYRESIRGKENCRKSRQLNKGHKHAETLLRGAKRRAFDKKLPFELDMEWLNSRLSACELTGLPFSKYGVTPFRPMLASIDRIDSSRGYTKENSRVICYALNSAFNEWGQIAFEPIAKAWLLRLANAVDLSLI